MKNKFVHLHVHSEYSLLDGLGKIKPLAAKAKSLGMNSLALTDHGNLYGAIRFYNACREEGIKPIIGVEGYVATGSRFQKEPGTSADRNHIILLAKNFEGYQNLMKLVSLSYLEGFYYKPRMDWELLKKYHRGIIAGSACIAGEIPSALAKKETKKAEKATKKFLDVFGKDFYLEIQHHPKLPAQNVANKGIIEISKKFGIPVVATNDIHYIEKDDVEAQDALLAIQTQKKVTDTNRLSMKDFPYLYLKSPQEMAQQFSQHPESIKNSLKIAERCNLEIPLGQKIYPHYELPKGETAGSYLKKLVEKRLPGRYPRSNKKIKDRIKYELGLIVKMGYPEYFLIIQDLTNWSKRQGIRVGPGRGSAAGSIVSYILRITSVDPIAHRLPFERFLNPERQSTPDIDLDFPDDRRDEVIEYVRKKYGDDHVAQIITFGRIESRMAVRDIARVLGYPYEIGDRIAKMVPSRPGKKISLQKAMEENPELEQAYKTEEEIKKTIDLAKKITGVVRHASVHAAGVVISDKPLTDYTPVQKDPKEGRIVTQYDMYALDLNVSDNAIGLLKMDFLGLRNLTILEKAVNFVLQTKKKKIDASEIPLDDKKVYKMIAKGDTTGVFQLESQGMRKLARKLKPNRFSDLSAMVALFRPGPMQFIDDFISGKKDATKIKYPHPDLKPILEETYGIAVYQEQCMEIPHVMASYTLGEADILRRAIGKKKIELMKKEKKRFISRSVKNGYKKQVAENVFSLIEKFAGYGFNKAHSVSYAMIAYQTAWMKAKYPNEFMAALLTADASAGAGKEEKISLAIQECRRMNIKILPPDINHSSTGFTLEKDKESVGGLAIRFGLSAIKNVGEAAIQEIIKVRKKEREFRSIADFCLKTSPQKMNKKVIESLIKAGAFDQFGKRKALLEVIEKVRSGAERHHRDKSSGQKSLFETASQAPSVAKIEFELPQVSEFDQEELLKFEKELFGFFLSSNPIENKLADFKSLATRRIDQIEENSNGEVLILIGVLINMRTVVTKAKGEQMCFLTLQDESGQIDIVVFPRLYRQVSSILIENSVIAVEGKADGKSDKISVIAQKIQDPAQTNLAENNKNGQNFTVNIPPGLKAQSMVDLNELIRSNPGTTKIILIFPNKKVLIPKSGINITPQLKAKIEKVLEN